jgi:hypothetical protein
VEEWRRLFRDDLRGRIPLRRLVITIRTQLDNGECGVVPPTMMISTSEGIDMVIRAVLM